MGCQSSKQLNVAAALEKEIHGLVTKALFCVKLNDVTYTFSAGYQGYIRHCRRGGAEDDGEVPALEDPSEKVKDFAMENGVFRYDDSSTAEEKKKDTTLNTHM